MSIGAEIDRKFAARNEIEAGLSRGTVYFTPGRVMAGLKLELKMDVPPPPATVEDVARMKRLNHCLIWQPEQTHSGALITMKAIHDACGNACHQGGKFLYEVNWYAREDFYFRQTPRGGWREVSLAPIPRSFGKTFCEQLRALVDYLYAEWPELSEEVQAAIFEFETQEQELLQLEQKDWSVAAKREASLKLCDWLTTPVEQSMLMLVHQKTNRERFLETVYVRTSELSSDGELVGSGNFVSGGAHVSGWEPDDHRDFIGVCFSRSLKS